MRDWNILIQKVIWYISKGKSREEIAEALDVKPAYLSVIIHQYRDKGYKIDDLRNRPQGAVLERTVRGVVYLYEKKGKEWVRIGRKDGQAMRTYSGRKKSGKPTQKEVRTAESKQRARDRRERIRQEALQKQVKTAQKAVKQPKKEEKRLPDRMIDENLYKYVVINLRTTVKALKEIPDEVVRTNWIKKQEMQNKRI